jgi:PAS domain S-box-containing protein
MAAGRHGAGLDGVDDDRLEVGRDAQALRVSRGRTAGQGGDRLAAAFGPAVLWGMLNALADGVVLADEAGVLVLANRRAEELFGYARGELAGQRVESLVPARVRAAHVAQRAGKPTAREMGARARLAGLRKDGTTLPVRINLSPVRTATGRYTMAVIRDITDDRPPSDLGELARAAAAEGARQGRELLGQVVDGLFRVGLSLQTAADLPDEVAVQRIADAVQHVDGIIGEIRDHVFAGLGDGPAPHPPPDEAR